jgi:hypothetical protein
MSVNFSMIQPGYGYGGGYDSGWGSGFGGCCNRMLGPQRSGLTGALIGGLVGTLGSGGNPLIGLLGAGVGSLIGSLFGGRNHCQHANHRGPCHQQASCYPPQSGHHFGGPQFGGYGCSPNFGNQYGGWGGGGYQNFGFQGGGQMWGAQQANNYQYQFPGGGSQWGGNYGQQWGGGNGCWSPGQNFNFGHQGPQSCCCPCQRPPQGQLSQDGGKGKPMEYKTSGGYTVRVDKHTITITDPQGKNKVEHWGDPHENLNGKHIKDWEGKQRSIILEDGTKITMTAQGPHGVTENTSIYDGRQNVQINNNTNEITHHSMNPRDTALRELRQYDGETAIFRTNDRTGVATYSNIYTEDSSFNITRSYNQLGRTGGYQNPSQVRDFYDDPRIGHT